jgi:hypothetical protein
VRKRLEKRMEVILTNVSSYYNGDRSVMKMRSPTFSPEVPPKDEFVHSTSSSNSFTNSSSFSQASQQEFIHSVQFFGNVDQCEQAKNSVALKLHRVQKDKSNDFVNLIFDIIFSPSKSFM